MFLPSWKFWSFSLGLLQRIHDRINETVGHCYLPHLWLLLGNRGSTLLRGEVRKNKGERVSNPILQTIWLLPLATCPPLSLSESHWALAQDVNSPQMSARTTGKSKNTTELAVVTEIQGFLVFLSKTLWIASNVWLISQVLKMAIFEHCCQSSRKL